MYNRLYNFLADHNIISKKQYGFSENYLTYMAIIDLVDKISSNIDSKKHSIGIFLDLSKAFDTIDHQILLRKRQCYGILGAIQVLRNADGGRGVSDFLEKTLQRCNVQCY